VHILVTIAAFGFDGDEKLPFIHTPRVEAEIRENSSSGFSKKLTIRCFENVVQIDHQGYAPAVTLKI
jgi:hypothetical protein